MTPGHKEFDDKRVPIVMRLLKSVDGLQQRPRCWYGVVDEHNVEVGLKSRKLDFCVYLYAEGSVTYIFRCADDALLPGKKRKYFSASRGN